MPDYSKWKIWEPNVLDFVPGDGETRLGTVRRREIRGKVYWEGRCSVRAGDTYTGPSRLEAMDAIERAYEESRRPPKGIEPQPSENGNMDPDKMTLTRVNREKVLREVREHFRLLCRMESEICKLVDERFPGTALSFTTSLDDPDVLHVAITLNFPVHDIQLQINADPSLTENPMEHIDIIINTTHAESLGIIKCAIEPGREELEYDADEEEKAIADAREWIAERHGDKAAEAAEVVHVANTAKG